MCAEPDPTLTGELIDWYVRNARELPWRERGVSAWAVLVSEVMLAQTPVPRVLPVWTAWQQRWPGPRELAAADTGDVLRAWGKLGYPRRALRLQQAAARIVEEHDGEVPADLDALLALPGVGTYTARAVLVFAFGQRHPVVDTNVRRVLARLTAGHGAAGLPSPSRDHAAALAVLPDDRAEAAVVSIALMELGALVCSAANPRCGQCPVASRCRWLAAGRPEYHGPKPKPQRFAGTDRQVRGLLLDVLRNAAGTVELGRLERVWHDRTQRERALAGLLADGLVEQVAAGQYALPSAPTPAQ